MTAIMGIYLFKFAFRRYGLKAACASLVLPLIMIAILLISLWL